MSKELGYSKGLAEVIADATGVSDVQGDKGRLIYRGINIEDLAAKSNFEECAYFLLAGKLPNKDELKKFDGQLKESRRLPKYAENIISESPKTAHPMSVLQTVIWSINTKPVGKICCAA